MTAKATAKGRSNVNAIHGWLRDPNGQVRKFENLTQFVRDHEYLFAFKDVLWMPSGKKKPGCIPQLRCKASRGLSRLFHGQKSWKGWTAGGLV